LLLLFVTVGFIHNSKLWGDEKGLGKIVDLIFIFWFICGCFFTIKIKFQSADWRQSEIDLKSSITINHVRDVIE
jgi:hypothetical protein